MILPPNIVSEFNQITNYDLTSFLVKYSDFIVYDRNNITNYYSGQLATPQERSFDLLKQLLDEISQIMMNVNNHKNSFDNAAFWELTDFLTEVETSLETIDNSSKWLRSVIGKNEFSQILERDDFLKQNETLELLSTRFGSTDKENDWATIALRNDLKEEDYTQQGGNILKVDITKTRSTRTVNTVVDTLRGKKLYGIDLSQKITFNQDEDDLLTLTYDQTIKQSISILAKLRQGDTPEFPLEGIQSSLVVGTNRNTVAYPILFRQFFSTFRTDDTLANLTIIDIKNQQDSLAITFMIDTILGQSLIEESAL